MSHAWVIIIMTDETVTNKNYEKNVEMSQNYEIKSIDSPNWYVIIMGKGLNCHKLKFRKVEGQSK